MELVAEHGAAAAAICNATSSSPREEVYRNYADAPSPTRAPQYSYEICKC